MTLFAPRTLLVTGGCGFIGSNFINQYHAAHPTVKIVNVDRLDYCASEDNLEGTDPVWYTFYACDITNADTLNYILRRHRPDAVIHFAAQSHVDNSFGNSLAFTRDNVVGTHTLLEQSLLNPTNPYAASKAAAEFFVRSYNHSYGLPTILTRGNNVYGPRQYPEKVIPRFIEKVLKGERMPIQGMGLATRNFIHVADVAEAVATILHKGSIGQIYNIGGDCELPVIEVARRILEMMRPADVGNLATDWIDWVPDRLFNDKRYAVKNDALVSLGWSPRIPFADGLRQTIEWYVQKFLQDSLLSR
jgi:UDP-glucose 4,6-dehydratase